MQAEIPTDQVTAQSLRLAITSVLDGVKQVKAIVRLDVVFGAVA
ncbi:MAG: hypothetical protein ABJA82_17825 [Myxococcales bacterium]